MYLRCTLSGRIKKSASAQLALRAAARQRKRRQRKRDKQKRLRALAAQQAVAERAERKQRDLHFFGEAAPRHNATTTEDELQIHREFLRALGKADVQSGETLRSVARRTFEAWLTGPFTCQLYGSPFYVPAFNRKTQQFDPDFGFEIGDAPFDELWTAPKDCSVDEPIDVETLSELPSLPNPAAKAKAKVEPAPPIPSSPPPIQREQPNSVRFAWIPPHARNYLTGR